MEELQLAEIVSPISLPASFLTWVFPLVHENKSTLLREYELKLSPFHTSQPMFPVQII